MYLGPLAIYFFKRLFFKIAFGLQHNEGEGIEVSHILLPPHWVASPLSTCPIGVVHLLRLINYIHT